MPPSLPSWLGIGLLCLSQAALAQIATDPTLPIDQPFSSTSTDLVSRITSDSGFSPDGSNVLSFSFSEFNVPAGGSATVAKGANYHPVELVVSRVTGGQQSQILGALRSDLGEKHFYFLNPWGVLFGANATVNVNGSFHVSTADEVR